MLRWAVRFHKWIALVVGVQVLGWVLGGLIMTAIPIEKVHGDQHAATPVLAPIDLKRLVPLEKQLSLADQADVGSATLKNTPRGPIWARRYALAAYKGAGKLTAVDYEEVAAKEAQVSGPLWRASFADAEHTRLYLDSFTGEVLSRRSSLWGLYDFFYQIHIMNFGASRTYNHPVIVAAAAATLVIVLSGFVLLWIKVSRDVAGLFSRRPRASPAAPG
jgi:uncharacterized iron-regulated membrane protein